MLTQFRSSVQRANQAHEQQQVAVRAMPLELLDAEEAVPLRAPSTHTEQETEYTNKDHRLPRTPLEMCNKEALLTGAAYVLCTAASGAVGILGASRGHKEAFSHNGAKPSMTAYEFAEATALGGAINGLMFYSLSFLGYFALIKANHKIEDLPNGKGAAFFWLLFSGGLSSTIGTEITGIKDTTPNSTFSIANEGATYQLVGAAEIMAFGSLLLIGLGGLAYISKNCCPKERQTNVEAPAARPRLGV